MSNAFVRSRVAGAEPLFEARRPQLGEIGRAEALESPRERLTLAHQRHAVGIGGALAATAVPA